MVGMPLAYVHISEVKMGLHTIFCRILKLQVPENGPWSHEGFGKTANPTRDISQARLHSRQVCFSVTHALPASVSECIVTGVSQ